MMALVRSSMHSSCPLLACGLSRLTLQRLCFRAVSPFESIAAFLQAAASNFQIHVFSIPRSEPFLAIYAAQHVTAAMLFPFVTRESGAHHVLPEDSREL